MCVLEGKLRAAQLVRHSFCFESASHSRGHDFEYVSWCAFAIHYTVNCRARSTTSSPPIPWTQPRISSSLATLRAGWRRTGIRITSLLGCPTRGSLPHLTLGSSTMVGGAYHLLMPGWELMQVSNVAVPGVACAVSRVSRPASPRRHSTPSSPPHHHHAEACMFLYSAPRLACRSHVCPLVRRTEMGGILGQQHCGPEPGVREGADRCR